MILRIQFTYTAYDKFFFCLFNFCLYPLIVFASQFGHLLDGIYICLLMILVISAFQTSTPAYFVQVKQHILFILSLSVVDGD